MTNGYVRKNIGQNALWWDVTLVSCDGTFFLLLPNSFITRWKLSSHHSSFYLHSRVICKFYHVLQDCNTVMVHIHPEFQLVFWVGKATNMLFYFLFKYHEFSHGILIKTNFQRKQECCYAIWG